MYKLSVLSIVFLVCFFSASVKSAECDISGIWNHSSKPATLLIDVSKGEVSVHSHENNSDAIGLVVLKHIELGAATSWQAKMYSAAEDSFVEVQISSLGCNQLTVSYRGEEVLGLYR